MKVDFIICTNSDLWCSECVKYLENLIVPENFEIGVLTITDASGMALGYELGRNNSDADYKVYLHQDTFIINRHFIEDIDAVFHSNDKIGVIGMIGNNDVEEQKFSWGSWRWGKVIACTGIKQLLLVAGEVTEQYQPVDCLDGMILVTRYDVPWRQDILTGWHFYDKSICLEYRRRGYLCVVPGQESPWCIHACGASELTGWNDSLMTYLNEYQDFFQKEKVLKNIELVDQNQIQRSRDFADQMESLIDGREMDEAASLMTEIVNGKVKRNKRLVFTQTLMEIWETGKCSLFFKPEDNVAEMWLKYIRASFLLRRKFYGLNLNEEETLFLSELTESERSLILQHELTLHNPIKKDVTEVYGILEQVAHAGHELAELLGEDADSEKTASGVAALAAMLEMVEYIVQPSIYEQYSEFFSALRVFCRQCGNTDFLLENAGEMVSSLELFEECMEDLLKNFTARIKMCPCCGHEVMYIPLPRYYSEVKGMQVKFSNNQ